MAPVGRQQRMLEAHGVAADRLDPVVTFKPRLFFSQLRQLRQQVRKNQYDLVVAQYGTWTGFFTSLACTALAPCIVTFRGSDLNPVPSEKFFRQCIRQLTSQLGALMANGIVCVSHQLEKRLWLPKRQSAVIPSTTQIQKFFPLDGEQCRQELEWAQEHPIALFILGYDAKVKRLDLAEAIRDELHRRHSKVDLKIIRSFTPTEQLNKMFNAADTLVFLSDYEGSPNLIREACATNLPIVSVDCGDVSEVLKSVTECTIADRDIAQLTDAVENTANRRIRNNGRETAKQYSADALAPRLIAFYRSMAIQPDLKTLESTCAE